MTDILDRIRSSCAAVAADSSHVTIDHDGLDRFAQRLDTTQPEPDPGQIEIGDEESTAAFVLSLDSINFGSGYFPYIKKRPGMSGYHTVATCLRDHVDRTGAITPQRLSKLTGPECARIFGQSMDVELQAELMNLFAQALNDLGGFIDNVGQGSFSAAIARADQSAAGLVDLLDTMPLFHDVHSHHGNEVPIYKRAQIVAQDLHIAFAGQGPGRFRDLDRLTMFADNLVPHVLRLEGALTFSASLIARIKAVDDIPVGSEAEVEIRGCSLHAVELLRSRLLSAGTGITSGDLDNVLWNLGSAPEYKTEFRHRTRCVYY